MFQTIKKRRQEERQRKHTNLCECMLHLLYKRLTSNITLVMPLKWDFLIVLRCDIHTIVKHHRLVQAFIVIVVPGLGSRETKQNEKQQQNEKISKVKTSQF